MQIDRRTSNASISRPDCLPPASPMIGTAVWGALPFSTERSVIIPSISCEAIR